MMRGKQYACILAVGGFAVQSSPKLAPQYRVGV